MIIIIIIINLCSKILLDKLIVAQLVKKFPDFHRIRSFITVFTRACYWNLSCSRTTRSTRSHSISIIFIPMLSYHSLYNIS